MIKVIKFTLSVTKEQHNELIELCDYIRNIFNKYSKKNKEYYTVDNLIALKKRYYHEIKKEFPRIKSCHNNTILKCLSNEYGKIKNKIRNYRRKIYILSTRSVKSDNISDIQRLTYGIERSEKYIPKLYTIIPLGSDGVKILEDGCMFISNLNDKQNLFLKVKYNNFNKNYSHGKFSSSGGYIYYSNYKKKWYVCLRFNIPDVWSNNPYIKTIGLDMGIKHIASLSDNKIFEFDDTLKKHIQKLSLLKDKLDGHKSSSARRHAKRIQNKIYRIHDYMCHLLSKQIINHISKYDYTHLAHENLDCINATSLLPMISSGKIKWNPKKLMKFIKYKAMLKGIMVYSIDPTYTSQRCHVCHEFGKRDGDDFYCKNHGHMHADTNAACNIAGRYTLNNKQTFFDSSAVMNLYGMIYKAPYTIDETKLRINKK